ncbi:MAG: glutamate--tRNA ligase [Proteobacteria bacterium]|nr:glutamate--tRNA ligase [Pseudomonadota bacterium]
MSQRIVGVVTRFAPSPTGYLHIGGARTALFNYLFARHHKGKYLLRIEDTDKARSSTQAIQAIHSGLDWLGLTPDNADGIFYQSAHIASHQKAAQTLLAQGAAYRCYLAGDELEAVRTQAHKSGKAIRSPWRDRPPQDAPKDTPSVVRLKMPDTGSTTLEDKIQGKVTIQNDQLDDLVLLRGDGSPTYMLAVVVDDHAMGVSHIIRGDDHFNNAFRQWHIIQALGWQAPTYAHIPLIHNSDGKKMSKRDGSVSVLDYKAQGFLPEAMVGYLLRLGWSHGDDEVISHSQAITWFGLDGIGASPARFDLKKLTAINTHYIRGLDDKALAEAVITHAKDNDATNNKSTPLAKNAHGRVTRLASALKKRGGTLSDLVDMAGFALYDTPPTATSNEVAQLDATIKSHLLQLAADYPDAPMDATATSAWLADWLDRQNITLRDIGPAVRMALTGSRTSPDIASVLASLGKQHIDSRIRAFVV